MCQQDRCRSVSHSLDTPGRTEYGRATRGMRPEPRAPTPPAESPIKEVNAWWSRWSTCSRYCTRQQLAEAVELVAQGRIRPVITRVCQLEEADEVLRSIERMELVGRACAMLP